MNFEVGKEYLYIDLKTKCRLVCISETDDVEYLIVYKSAGDGEYIGWVPEGCLKELPPYHDFKRGEPVIASGPGEHVCRRYFSHVDDKGRPHCFDGGNTAWAVKLKYINKDKATTVAWDSVRKLTEEEKAEARKDHEVMLQYFSS